MAKDTKDQLTLSVEGRPVSPPVVPGSAEARRTTAGSGRKLSALLRKSNPAGLLLKTLLASSTLWSSPLCLLRWRASAFGTMKTKTGGRSSRLSFRLVPLALSTDEIEYGSSHGEGMFRTPLATDGSKMGHGNLPHQVRKLATAGGKMFATPCAGRFNESEPLEKWEARRQRVKALKKNGNGFGAPLGVQVRMFPTPTVTGNNNRKGLSPKSGDGLATAVRRMFATPQARDFRTGEGKRWVDEKRSRNLNDQVAFLSGHRLLPTPTCQDSSNNAGESQFDRNSLPLNAVVGGALNPEWVEWLMGFPVGWTDLKGLATPSFRKSRSRSASRSRSCTTSS